MKDYDNSEKIKKFLNNCIASGIGERRVDKYAQLLSWIDENIGVEFDKAARQDIENLVVKINQNKSLNKRGGRVRIATPNFDFRKLLKEKYYSE
jgi:hypothetical protein